MDTKELLGIMATLATITAGLVAVTDHMGEDAPAAAISPAPQPPSDHMIVILARTEFNDSGNAYVEQFDGGVIHLNSSVQVIYLVGSRGREDPSPLGWG